MSRIRMIAMAGGTLACVLGIGFFVQNGANAPKVTAPNPTMTLAAFSEPAIVLPVIEEDAPLDVQGIVLTSSMPDTPAPQRVIEPQSSAYDLILTRDECKVTALAAVADRASVDLAVSAPCFSNERVTIYHNGMTFTDATDDRGNMKLNIPALTDHAVFIVALANGQGAVAMAQVSDLAKYNRVVLQWVGESGFQIHAREFGADYGAAGHVWHGMDHSLAGGSLVRLGDPNVLAPRLAEIYTYPVGLSDRSGSVTLSIETEVTAQNCGQDVAAQTLELSNGDQLRTRDMVLSVPECVAIGDFLVLNNLVDDMKIAAN